MNATQGKLRELINELSTEQLMQKDSGLVVYNHIFPEFERFLIAEMPKVLEENLFSHKNNRDKSESLTQYCDRMRKRWKKLEAINILLQDATKGYILARGAHIYFRRAVGNHKHLDLMPIPLRYPGTSLKEAGTASQHAILCECPRYVHGVLPRR